MRMRITTANTSASANAQTGFTVYVEEEAKQEETGSKQKAAAAAAATAVRNVSKIT